MVENDYIKFEKEKKFDAKILPYVPLDLQQCAQMLEEPISRQWLQSATPSRTKDGHRR